jgi:hypothetical protein
MVRAARRYGGDISAAARALGVALTDHATVLARAKAAVAKIEAGMAWAQRSGVLHEFNQEYRRRRLAARESNGCARHWSPPRPAIRRRSCAGCSASDGAPHGLARARSAKSWLSPRTTEGANPRYWERH